MRRKKEKVSLKGMRPSERRAIEKQFPDRSTNKSQETRYTAWLSKTVPCGETGCKSRTLPTPTWHDKIEDYKKFDGGIRCDLCARVARKKYLAMDGLDKVLEKL